MTINYDDQIERLEKKWLNISNKIVGLQSNDDFTESQKKTESKKYSTQMESLEKQIEKLLEDQKNQPTTFIEYI